ncbi:MAG: hypothetical protein NTX17_04945 [Candidatus Eisenbacteria bacterium]|nr:hypothetical protein [Candidatus Eisenbacteria bacterium]
MNNSIQKSIIQRVRDLLNMRDECSPIELHSRLREYCHHIHPDRFVDAESKKTAEARFKAAQELMPELFRFIQDEAIRRTPAELMLYRPIYDNVFTQHELDEANKEIERLKHRIECGEFEIEQLKDELKRKEDARFQEERRNLEKLYKPTPGSLASLGLVFMLGALMPAMNKVKETSDFISQYSPFSPATIKMTLFVLFVTMLFLTLKQYIENLLLRRRVQEVCSTRFSIDFMNHLSYVYTWEDCKRGKFTESHAFDFIAGNRAKWKSLLAHIGFPLFRTSTYELLKNCFIGYLIQKQLIEISNAEDLNRTFTVKDAKYYWRP